MRLPRERSESRLPQLVRIGLMTAALVLVMTQGLGVFAPKANAFGSGGGVPTGLPASPTCFPPNPCIQKFTQPMPRFDVLPRNAVSTLVPAPTAQANTTQQPMPAALGGRQGPIDRRTTRPLWAHHSISTLPPPVPVDKSYERAYVPNRF